MTRALLKIAGLCVLIVAGAVVVAHVTNRSPLQEQVNELQSKLDEANHAVERLTATRRVAQLLVTDQHVGPDGVPRTTLLVEEYAADGGPATADAATGDAIAPLRVTIVGDEAHLDATIITFHTDLTLAGDPMRGHSMLLFTKLFGNHQPPADGTPIDTPDRLGQLDRGTDPRVSTFQRSLWRQFWQLAEDPDARRKCGVSSAGGEGVWFRCKPDQLYTVTLQATGGLSVSGEPLKGIYRDALHAAARP